MYEHYLMFLEKIEESRSFEVFVGFLGEKYGEKREKKMLKNAQNMVRKERKMGFFSLGPI